MMMATPHRYPTRSRMRQQVGHEPESEDPRGDGDSANDEREGRRQGGVLGVVASGQRGDHRRGHQRGRRLRTHRKLPGRAQHGVDGECGQNRPQTDDGFEPGEARVRHDLGNEVRRHRDASQDVAAKPAALVAAEQAETGQQ
jgi:hypothetical protein